MAVLPAAHSATINASLTGFTSDQRGVVQHVMNYWADTIVDPFTVSISVSMLDLAGDMLGSSFDYIEDSAGRPVSGTIQIDNRAGSVIGWFVDLTPETNEEFGPGGTPYHHYGRRPGSAGQDYDLVTVLHHEFAHLFGFSMSYSRFAALVTPSDIPPLRSFTGSTTSALLTAPYEGTHLSDGAHPFDLMNPYQSRGERLVPSDLDLAMLSDTYGYTIQSDQPEPIPEPLTLLLTGAGLLCLRLRK